MSTELSGAIQIDRLSSLPPELLSDIFDLAHDPEHPLIKSVSRTLLPYHRRTLYRQIRISSSSSLSKLLAAVETTPSLALLVHDLRIAHTPDMAHVEFESVARRFTSLKSLSYGRAQLSKVNFVAPLQSLSYSPEVFDANEIAAISRLPLIKLELRFYICEIEIPDNFQPSTMMPTVEEITLAEAYSTEDDDAWDTNFSRFVRSCPKLRSLKLVEEASPGFEKFLEALVGGVPHLTKLELDTPALDEISLCRFSHLYPLFPNLTYLGLGEGTTAPDLASHLRQLSFLSTLRLGPEAHYGFESAENLFSLVQGSTKPPALKVLILDCFTPFIGYRCDTEDEMSPQMLESWFFRKGWVEPRFWEDTIEEAECRQLLELARANEVQVKGDIYVAVDYEKLWDLEVMNRHLLFAYQNQTLEQLKSFEAAHLGAISPGSALHIEKLTCDILELVKIDLPEEGWFRLSLGSGGNVIR
ncbi:hypothetical protein JCM5350_003094 [Sporobolomyces pararoseus]